MPTVKTLTLSYVPVNDQSFFSEGDKVTGNVTLELEKEAKIESLFVKAKGDINVHWSEKHGDHSRNYSAHRRLFKQKQILIAEETTLPPGIHVFEFNFKMPLGIMPSSFRGSHGKVVYKLEAKLGRSWRMDCTDEKEICFKPTLFPNLGEVKYPLAGSTNKEVGIFSKGTVHMDVTIDRRGYAPGDIMTIVAKINNSSSKDVTPKFNLIQDVVYRASGNTKHEKKSIMKQTEDCVKPHTQKEVKSSLRIPSYVSLSINNCDLLTVEYRLKAYLDISFSYDPEVVFQVVIIPHKLSPKPEVCVNAAGAAMGPSTSDFPPPAAFPEPCSQSPANSVMYAGAPSMHPVPPQQFAGGYSNPVPLQQNPYGSPYSSSSSSSVLHPPPPSVLIPQPPPFGPATSAHSSGPPTYNTLPPVGSDGDVPAPPTYPSAPVIPTVPSQPSVPSAPAIDDFLSQTDDKPPSYEILFPPFDGAK